MVDKERKHSRLAGIGTSPSSPYFQLNLRIPQLPAASATFESTEHATFCPFPVAEKILKQSGTRHIPSCFILCTTQREFMIATTGGLPVFELILRPAVSD